MVWFNCNDMKTEFGLSCIENYVIYLLSQKNVYWAQVFASSYLSLDRVMEQLKEGQSYSYFFGVERVHKIAVKQGKCNLEYYKIENLSDEIICNMGTFLVQVKETYMQDKYRKKLWRSDHYILVRYRGDNTFEYINDNPLDCGVITLVELKALQADNIIKLEICENSQRENSEIVEQLKSCISNQLKEETEYYKIIFNDLSVEQLRDGVSIVKVLIKRMEALFAILGEKEFLSDYYSYLSKCYLKIEYMRLKKVPMEDIVNLLSEIREKDIMNRQLIYSKLNAISI